MKIWEYKIKEDLAEEELNDLGKIGWELISIVWAIPINEDFPINEIFYFKREIINQ